MVSDLPAMYCLNYWRIERHKRCLEMGNEYPFTSAIRRLFPALTHLRVESKVPDPTCRDLIKKT